MRAIVLVGGEGTRLRPLTETVPKPALTLVDRPMLAYTVEWLARHGVEEVVLACGFMPERLRGALGDGEGSGVRIRYVAEPRPLGTAGGIRYAADQLGEGLGERFVALNGDILTDLDLSALLAAHREGGGEATIGLHPVEDSSPYGLVRRDESGGVLAFEEKTADSSPGEVNAGIYVLERSVLGRIPMGEAVSIERDIFPVLAGDGLRAVPLDGYWIDIGTPERYLQATWDILERRVETEVEPTGPGMLVDPAAEISEGAALGPRVVVGPGCSVASGAEVRESVLLEGCRLGPEATVTGSILAPGVEVAEAARLDGAVVGRDERVPA
jgi:mannose-1-phosphate guanylyltransferase